MFCKQLSTTFRSFVGVFGQLRTLTTTVPKFREITDRKEMLRSLPKADDGSAGEKAIEVDYFVQ